MSLDNVSTINRFVELIKKILSDGRVDDKELFLFLSLGSKADRCFCNTKIANAFYLLDTDDGLIKAQKFVKRAWLLSEYSSKEVLELYIKIHGKLGDTSAVKEAYKRIGIHFAKTNNVSEAIGYFNKWHYAYCDFEKLDIYDYDADIMNAIEMMAAPYKFAPSKPKTEAKIRVAYLVKGTLELNSVLVKINALLSTYHDKELFEVSFIIPESESNCEKYPHALANIQMLKNSGCNIIHADDHEDDLLRLLSVGQKIFNYQPHVLVYSAALSLFEHYFIACLKTASIQVCLNQGPSAQFSWHIFNHAISWYYTNVGECPLNVNCVPLEFNLDHYDGLSPLGRDILELPENSFILLSAGRYPKFQNQDFWKAILSVLKENENVIYLVVGFTLEQVPFLEKLAGEQILDRIKFFKWRSDYLNVLACADLIVDSYPIGGGVVMIDSMALGKPIISFHHDYLTINDGSFGSGADEELNVPELFIERGNFNLLYEKISKLILNQDELKRLGKLCREAVLADRSNPERMTRRCEKIYTQLLQEDNNSLTRDHFLAHENITQIRKLDEIFFLKENFKSEIENELNSSNEDGICQSIINRENIGSENKSHPFFTIVVPTYNQAEFLGLALDSLLGQSFDNWEAVIVNDGSTDNTFEVMQRYKTCDKRFRTYHKENGGVSTALNVGIRHAKGEWICWLSSDDWYETDKLENHYNAINEYPDIKFFISHWSLYLQQSGQKLNQALWLDIPVKEFQVTRFFLANYVHGNSIAIHKSVFINVGVFDEALRQGQDFDMWLRIAAQYQVHFINKRTCVTRIHAGQTTNTFIEGGVLDSTRALFKFLNNHTFENLFPFSDLSNPQDILKAVNEIIYVTVKDNAFIYKCGFTSALIDKTLFWINKQSVPLRSAIHKKITEIVSFYMSNSLHPEVKILMNRFLTKKISVVEKHDFVEDGMKYVDALLDCGEQRKARAIETYFNKISIQSAEDLAGYKKFQPKLLGYPKVEEYKQLSPSHIESWIIHPGIIHPNSVQHKISFKCPECGAHSKINFEYLMTALYSENNFICPECKTGLEYNDKELGKNLMEYNRLKFKNKSQNQSNKTAFFIASASVIGGGSKVLIKYINWLSTLGVDVTLYSFSEKPDWVKIKARFVQLSENSAIDVSTYNRIFVFSIYDVSMMINYAPLEKIVHVCQGYEGYHFGTTFEELRSDKHVLTELHAIPVKNIVVSKHLAELYKTKFCRETEYVPNGVDHNIFYPNFNRTDREKAIAFIGNPKHLLKGFHFLAHSVKVIQNSSMRIEDLKLYLVFGFELQDSEETREKLELELNCKVEFLMRQSSEEVAKLLRRVRAVACTSWYEGFSLPLLEGMACGTPVISTRNMGAESFCRDEYNSFLVNHGDLAELTGKLTDLLYLKYDVSNIFENGLTTSIEYSEYNSCSSFINSAERLLNKSFAEEMKQKLLSDHTNFSRADLDRYGITDSNETSALTVDDHIKESNFYMTGNNLEVALKHIEQALVLSPDEQAHDFCNSDLLNLAGNLNYTLGNYDKAQYYFEQQLIFSPESSSACFGLGEVFSAREEYDNAKVMYEWSAKNNPQNQSAMTALEKINIVLGYDRTHNSLLG